MAVAGLCYLGFRIENSAAAMSFSVPSWLPAWPADSLWKTSALYNRLYESGLIDHSFSAYYTAEETFAILS